MDLESGDCIMTLTTVCVTGWLVQLGIMDGTVSDFLGE